MPEVKSIIFQLNGCSFITRIKFTCFKKISIFLLEKNYNFRV